MSEQSKKPVKPEIAILQKDIDIFSGYLLRLENPDPVLRSEAHGKGLKFYDEIMRDTQAGSVLDTRALAVVGKEWSMLPGTSGRKGKKKVSTDQDQEIADYVTDVLLHCNFDQGRQELLRCILYGHYELEVMWKYDDEGVKIDKFIGKHPKRFSFTYERELRLLTLANIIEGEKLPPRKFISMSFGDTDNPYGKGLGQSLWFPIWFKKNGLKFWLIFLDKFGSPLLKGTYPQGTEEKDKDKFLDAMNETQKVTGILVPQEWVLELLEATKSEHGSYQSICEYLDRSVSKRVLGQTASTEGTAGKLGNEEQQGEVRQDILEADSDLLDTCLNNSMIKWIVDFNFPGVKSYPTIETHAAKKPDLKEQSEIDKTLIVDIGLPVSKQYLYEKYGIPEPEAGDDLLVVSAPKTPDINTKPLKADNVSSGFAESQPDVRQKKSLPEMMADQLDDALANVMDGKFDQVKSLISEAIRDGKSRSEFSKNLLRIFPKVAPRSFAEMMQRAFVAAELNGRADVMEE